MIKNLEDRAQFFWMKNFVLTIVIALFALSLVACGAGSSAGDISTIELSVSHQSTDNSSLPPGEPAVVSLSWIPPTEYTDDSVMNDLSGYKIYYGTSPGTLMYLMDVGPHLTSYIIENDQRIIMGTTYYFGITAYNSLNVESAMSNIVHYDL